MESTAQDVSGSWWLTTPCGVCQDFHKLWLFPNGMYAKASPTLLEKYGEWAKHTTTQSCKQFFKRKERSGNGAPCGAFAFTITKSDKDPYSVGDMLTAVRKIMGQKSCPVVKYAWYYEDKGRDDNGDPIHPHIHGMYETATGGRIERKHFKRAWPIWDETKPIGAGFRGGYHRPVKSEECYNEYMKKDGGMSESKGMDEQTE